MILDNSTYMLNKSFVLRASNEIKWQHRFAPPCSLSQKQRHNLKRSIAHNIHCVSWNLQNNILLYLYSTRYTSSSSSPTLRGCKKAITSKYCNNVRTLALKTFATSDNTLNIKAQKQMTLAEKCAATVIRYHIFRNKLALTRYI